MILLHVLICSGCGLSKLTLFWQRWPRAKNLRFFHSTSHQKLPCSTFAISICLRKKHINYSLFFALFFVRNKRETMRKKEKKNKKIISRNMFSIKNQMQFIPLFVDCCHFCSFLFMSFHFFYFLFISFHFLHVSSLAKTITNQDPLHVDPLLSFVEVFSFLLR